MAIDYALMRKKVDLIENLFSIANKDGETVPFILNEVQRQFALQMSGRDIIVKARQEGFSSFIEALFVLDCIAHENVRAVVIAHDKESTQRLFARAKFFISTMKGPKPKLQYDSRTEITFPKTNSDVLRWNRRIKAVREGRYYKSASLLRGGILGNRQGHPCRPYAGSSKFRNYLS